MHITALLLTLTIILQNGCYLSCIHSYWRTRHRWYSFVPLPRLIPEFIWRHDSYKQWARLLWNGRSWGLAKTVQKYTEHTDIDPCLEWDQARAGDFSCSKPHEHCDWLKSAQTHRKHISHAHNVSFNEYYTYFTSNFIKHQIFPFGILCAPSRRIPSPMSFFLILKTRQVDPWIVCFQPTGERLVSCHK
jgi:hypothetical protein